MRKGGGPIRIAEEKDASPIPKPSWDAEAQAVASGKEFRVHCTYDRGGSEKWESREYG